MATSKKKEDSVSKTKAVATIPWLSTPSNTQRENAQLIKLEERDFCEEMLECEGKRNFKFYQMLNQIFPYFLPKRYHTMDSWSMHEMSKHGQYWNHASHFLMLNQMYSGVTFSYLFEELKFENPDLSKFVPSCDIMGEVTKLEQCESAAEFLLEPWVLIQLPQQPVLLHQWMVALMAETLKFQKELAEVLYLPHPSHMSSQLGQLEKMLEILFEATMQITELVFEWCVPPKALTEQFSEKLLHTQNKLNFWLPQVMPILEFVLSEEGKKIIKALKKLTWNKKNQLSHHDFKRGCLQTKPLDVTKLFSMYSFQFWKNPKPIFGMYYVKTAEDFANFKSLDQHIKEFVEAGRGIHWIKPARDDFCKLIEEHIIKPGRMKGVSKDKILKAINWKDTKIKFYFNSLKLIFYTGATSQQNFVRDENYGAIFNIINLYADLKFEEAVVGLMSVLASQLINQGVYFGPVGCDDATGNVKMSDIKRALASVKPNNKWLHENMLKQVKATCFSPQRQLVPDYNQGPKIIAEHFQERIKNLVFKMIETQSRMMKDSTVYVYPECQTVQYLLPCFVASFLDLEKDKSVSHEKKMKYLKFVHELVKSYEEKEFMQTLVKGWTKKGWFTEAYQNKLMNWKVGHWVQNIKDCLPKEIASGRVLDAFCGNVLDFLSADICGPFEASYFTYKQGRALKPWTLKMFMFLGRVNNTLEDLTWLDDSMFHAVNFMAIMYAHVQTVISIETPTTEETFEPENEFMTRPDVKDLCKQLYDCSHEMPSEGGSCICVLGMCSCLYIGASFMLQNKKDTGDLQNMQGPCFPVDTTDSMIWNLEHHHWWKLMHQIKNFLSKCPSLKNKSLTVTLEVARENGGCYLEDLTSAGKVQMSRPGEITFFPVEHCRWCGLVEVKEFRKCPECLENPDYLDVNIFCSEKCEKEALEKQHMEEHARFLMEKCGLFN